MSLHYLDHLHRKTNTSDENFWPASVIISHVKLVFYIFALGNFHTYSEIQPWEIPSSLNNW